MLGCPVVHSASMSECCGQRHFLYSSGIGHLALRGSGGSIRSLPGSDASRRILNMPAERALTRFVPACDGVKVVRQEFLTGRKVDLSPVLLHQLQPAGMARIF